jgi:hypothetical protein
MVNVIAPCNQAVVGMRTKANKKNEQAKMKIIVLIILPPYVFTLHILPSLPFWLFPVRVLPSPAELWEPPLVAFPGSCEDQKATSNTPEGDLPPF